VVVFIKRLYTQKRDVLIQLSFLTSIEIHTFEIFLLAVFRYLNVTYLKYLQYLTLDTDRGVCRSLSRQANACITNDKNAHKMRALRADNTR
jgi:hypothetical protein